MTRPGSTNHRQVYRTAGLNPIQYESAGKRRDSVISREGSVELRRALIDLGVGLWLNDPAAKVYGTQLRARGKKGLVIACAMAHRANRIAFALVRDQTDYDPSRWIRGGLTRPFTTPVSSARLDGTKDPDQTPYRLWQTPQDVMPHLAWRPGPSPSGSPNEARRPAHRRGRIRQRGRPGTPTAATCRPTRPRPAPSTRSRSPTPTHGLDATYSQLDPVT